MNEAEFPAPIRLNGRIFFDDHELENYKRRLLGLPELPRDPSAKIKLRPAAAVAAELGICRRTVGRRIAGRAVESDAA